MSAPAVGGVTAVRPVPSVTDGDVLPILLRYRDQYQWSWNMAKRLINMYYGTQYTEKQLKALYKRRK